MFGWRLVQWFIQKVNLRHHGALLFDEEGWTLSPVEGNPPQSLMLNEFCYLGEHFVVLGFSPTEGLSVWRRWVIAFFGEYTFFIERAAIVKPEGAERRFRHLRALLITGKAFK
ncbi:hypothetical protein GCM10007877_22990 [Marinibactrum halimedae]|uniref:Uncharacterized protein n=1 Tax=Marinibactrum halimedae TaxID=1444977 RepID=A0AA37WMN6_9GAMM|nr:hypothetical protein GCM10007877_22990 [Marinibactrum halimedae]